MGQELGGPGLVDRVQLVAAADVGGDGRADFIRTGHTGVTHIWLNRLTDPDLE